MTDQIEAVWRHLPNAALIGNTLADAKDWNETYDCTWGVREAVGFCTWYEARCAARRKALNADAVRRRTMRELEHIANGQVATWSAAYDVLLALVAWDSSAKLLDLTPAALHEIIDTRTDDMKHQAVLLLPAAIVWRTA